MTNKFEQAVDRRESGQSGNARTFAKVKLFNYDLFAEGKEAAIDWALAQISNNRIGAYVVCANPHSLVVANEDSEFQAALIDADIVLPDGIGVTVAAKMIHGKSLPRVTGSDFFAGLIGSANENRKLRFFFLGSTDVTLGSIQQRLRMENEFAEYVGAYSPPFAAQFSDREVAKMLALIEAAKPDVLCVGMTAPKQEKWIHKYKDSLRVPITCAIGAVFDYYAGAKRRPDWVVRFGLEWLMRLAQEPRRLWRRTLVSGPRFLHLIIQEVRKKRDHSSASPIN